jgi:hypothetical protein
MKTFTNLSNAKWLLPLCFASFIFNSCQKEHNPVDQETKYNTFNGTQIKVGNGYAHTFITRSHTGVPQELGVVFTDEALSGLPTTNTPYILDFHHKALESTPFKHVALGWSATGHPLPGGAFMGPHFDVRFFMLSLEERLNIPAPPAPELYILPPTGYMPANYYPDVPGPQIGMHWTDKSFVAGVPVKQTMILGSFNGKFTFVSPIVLQSELASGTRTSLPYSQPQTFAKNGYYPTKYNIYEDDKKQHYVTLSDFVWR